MRLLALTIWSTRGSTRCYPILICLALPIANGAVTVLLTVGQ
ncbi:hypothetical protein ATKI12_5075 [Kitasatospora sp. Ki12]